MLGRISLRTRLPGLISATTFVSLSFNVVRAWAANIMIRKMLAILCAITFLLKRRVILVLVITLNMTLPSPYGNRRLVKNGPFR